MLKNATVVTLLGLTSQIAGYLRMAIIAYYYGLSAQIDAYYLALAIPSLLTLIFSNWLQLAFVGRYTALVTEKRTEFAASFRTTLLAIVFILSSLVCLLGLAFPAAPFHLLLPAPNPDASAAFQWLIIMVVPVVIADFMGQALNAHGRFGLAALAPLANAGVAVLTLWYWQDTALAELSDSPLAPLIGSLLLGAVTQLLVIGKPFLNLSRLHLTVTPELRQEMKTVLRHTGYILPAIALSGAMLSIMQFSVAQLGAISVGSVAAMTFANRLNNGLSQLMVIGFSTVLLPQFATLATRGEHDITFHLLRRLARGSVFIGLTLCVMAYLFAEPVIELLFVRGAFATHHAQITSEILLILCLSLPALALGTFIARYYSALRRVDLLLWSGLIGFTGVTLIAAAGVAMQNVLLIAAAPLVAYLLTLSFWLRQLAREFSITLLLQDIGHALWRTALVATAVVIADSALVSTLSSNNDLITTAVRATTASLLLGVVVMISGTLQWLLDPYRSTPTSNPGKT